MHPEFSTYFFVGLFLLVALAFPVLPLLLAKWIAPKKPAPTKTAAYECGVESTGNPWIQFNVQYYLYALLFVIFDIEVIFIYPWALALKGLGPAGFVEMALFIGILTIALVYAWKQGVLEWQ